MQLTQLLARERQDTAVSAWGRVGTRAKPRPWLRGDYRRGLEKAH